MNQPVGFSPFEGRVLPVELNGSTEPVGSPGRVTRRVSGRGPGFISHFGRLSGLSLPKEATLLTPSQRIGFGAVIVSKKGKPFGSSGLPFLMTSSPWCYFFFFAT